MYLEHLEPRRVSKISSSRPRTKIGPRRLGTSISPRFSVHLGLISSLRFKLHLQPRSMKSSSHSRPPLPRQKTAQDVFADFIAYLYRCAATYIQETHGDLLWLSIEKHIDFVLSHPNGWEGHQQKILRRAAVTAGLFTDDRDGHARLEFVTEGEASLNFCISQGLTTAAMQVSLPGRYFGVSTSDLVFRMGKESSSSTPGEGRSISVRITSR